MGRCPTFCADAALCPPSQNSQRASLPAVPTDPAVSLQALGGGAQNVRQQYRHNYIPHGSESDWETEQPGSISRPYPALSQLSTLHLPPRTLALTQSLAVTAPQVLGMRWRITRASCLWPAPRAGFGPFPGAGDLRKH